MDTTEALLIAAVVLISVMLVGMMIMYVLRWKKNKENSANMNTQPEVSSRFGPTGTAKFNY